MNIIFRNFFFAAGGNHHTKVQLYDESYGINGRLIVYYTDAGSKRKNCNHFILMLCKDGPELQPLKDCLNYCMDESDSSPQETP